jgi:hypothetical protein
VTEIKNWMDLPELYLRHPANPVPDIFHVLFFAALPNGVNLLNVSATADVSKSVNRADQMSPQSFEFFCDCEDFYFRTLTDFEICLFS